jgi:hypothetical protein
LKNFEKKFQISSFIGKEEQMNFNEDGTVSFMNFIWLGREFENDSYKMLYLLRKENQKIFRIKLTTKLQSNFMDGFVSGEFRSMEDGDFFLKAVLFPVSCTPRNQSVTFKDIGGLLKFIPKEHQIVQKVQKVEKDESDDFINVKSWSSDEVFDKLIKYKILDQEEAEILKNEKIDGEVLVGLDLGLKFGPSRN